MAASDKTRLLALAAGFFIIAAGGCDDRETGGGTMLRTENATNLKATTTAAGSRPASGANSPRTGEQTSVSQSLDLGEDWERASAARWAGDGAADAAGGRETWAIVLNTFTGESHQQAAANMVNEIRRLAPQYSEARVHTTDKGSMVIYGSYAGPQDEAAKAELQRVKSLKVRQMQLFRRAMLTKVDDASTARLHPYDLRTVRQRYPGVKTLYTLDIALWGDDEKGSMRLEDIHRKAEDFVRQLRAQNIEAYFHHDDARMLSTVTVGVFGVESIDPQSGVIGPEVRRWIQRFPKRLVNGEPLLIKKNRFDRSPNAETYAQEPFLVEVPK